MNTGRKRGRAAAVAGQAAGDWNADVLEDAIRQMGLNGLDLAAKLRVSEHTVSRWRTGKIAPPPKERRRIERQLGLEAGSLDRAGGAAAVSTPPAVSAAHDGTVPPPIFNEVRGRLGDGLAALWKARKHGMVPYDLAASWLLECTAPVLESTGATGSGGGGDRGDEGTGETDQRSVR